MGNIRERYYSARGYTQDQIWQIIAVAGAIEPGGWFILLLSYSGTVTHSLGVGCMIL